MKSLYDLHLANNARMGIYNNRAVPTAYNESCVEYKAVRENVLLVDYSHMAIVSVMGNDAWLLINHMASADISIIRDEQGIYSLVLSDDGMIRGDAYVLCTAEGYYILSENLSAFDIIDSLNNILIEAETLDIREVPEIKSMDEDDWGAILLEGPYAWEVMAEHYGYDIIGLPYFEYINEDDGLMVLRCGRHGEFAYMMIGPQTTLAQLWLRLLDIGEKYLLKVGGLEYLNTVRVENPGWDESLFSAFTRNPVELQLQWAIQYDKENFIGKDAAIILSRKDTGRKLVGIIPATTGVEINANDKVYAEEKEIGVIVKAVFSPALQSIIALALIDSEFAWSDIAGFSIHTASGDIAAKTNNIPFIYNFSLLVNPAEHSFIDASRAKSGLSRIN